MTQLVLPNTIDAGTEITAAEHQTNYVAIRDLINGQIEGGTTTDSNVKAKGLTMRELNALALQFAGASAALQNGVMAAGDGKVTPGAGLQLNYAAGTALIVDDGSVHTSGLLIPATFAGSTVTIGGNATGNPRIDQVVLTLSALGTASVSVVPGTATVGATLTNRTGAAALPAKSIRLADILMPTGFAGPFIAATHIRDRRPWARGAYSITNDTAGDISLTIGAVSGLSTAIRAEFTGNPVTVTLNFAITSATLADASAKFNMNYDGALVWAIDQNLTQHYNGYTSFYTIDYTLVPAAGSHSFQFAITEVTNDIIIKRSGNLPVQTVIREDIRQNSDNSGA